MTTLQAGTDTPDPTARRRYLRRPGTSTTPRKAHTNCRDTAMSAAECEPLRSTGPARARDCRTLRRVRSCAHRSTQRRTRGSRRSQRRSAPLACAGPGARRADTDVRRRGFASCHDANRAGAPAGGQYDESLYPIFMRIAGYERPALAVVHAYDRDIYSWRCRIADQRYPERAHWRKGWRGHVTWPGSCFRPPRTEEYRLARLGYLGGDFMSARTRILNERAPDLPSIDRDQRLRFRRREKEGDSSDADKACPKNDCRPEHAHARRGAHADHPPPIIRIDVRASPRRRGSVALAGRASGMSTTSVSESPSFGKLARTVVAPSNGPRWNTTSRMTPPIDSLTGRPMLPPYAPPESSTDTLRGSARTNRSTTTSPSVQRPQLSCWERPYTAASHMGDPRRDSTIPSASVA